MTLRIRNRIILLLLFTSIIIALFISGLYIYAFLKNAIIAPVMPIRQFNFPTLSIFALRYNFPCSLIASAVFLFYSLFFLFWIFVRFEKTQSPEIFYFCLFLCSTLCESFKLLVPLFALWQTYSNNLLFIGRLILFGKFLAPISILMSSLFSTETQMQDFEKNYTIVITLGAAFSLLIPINTSQISTTCAISWGFYNEFFLFRTLIFITAFISSVLKGINKTFTPSALTVRLSFSLLLIILSYALLASADNLLFLIAGSTLLFISTLRFLTNTHMLYY